MFYMNPYPTFPIGCLNFDYIVRNGEGTFHYAHFTGYKEDDIICIYPILKACKRRQSMRLNVRITHVERVDTGNETTPYIYLHFVEVVYDYLLIKFKPII